MLKPSHIRTPRTLSECYFSAGDSTIEPAMWGSRWNSGLPPKKRFILNNLSALSSIGIGLVVIVAASLLMTNLK